MVHYTLTVVSDLLSNDKVHSAPIYCTADQLASVLLFFVIYFGYLLLTTNMFLTLNWMCASRKLIVHII